MQSAAAIDEIITFEAGPSADDVISIIINITDDLVALEATESYIATLEVLGTPASRIEIGEFPTTNVSVLDDDGRLLAQSIPKPLMLLPTRLTVLLHSTLGLRLFAGTNFSRFRK